MALRFEIDAEGGVSGRFQADASMQGYDGILHGGMICALLDAAMTHCLFSLGISAVTGDMRVRFLRSVPCGALVELKARLVKARPPLYRVSAELSENTRVAARATATFMKRPDRLERENVL